MTEGWFGDDYLISLNEAEVASASDRYSISRFIPGHQVIGLRGWDDLIVRDSVGLVYTVPSVAMDSGFLSRYVFPEAESSMVPEERFLGRIKWYVQPIVFGGDPNYRDECYLGEPRRTRAGRHVVERPLSLSEEPTFCDG